MKQLGLLILFSGFFQVTAMSQFLKSVHGVTDPYNIENDACSLPAPGQFTVSAKGTDWVQLRWTSVPNAWGYEVKAFRLPAGILDTQIITTATDISLKDLRAGAAYRFSVSAVCPNLLVSPYPATEISNLIILELVVNAHIAPPVCPLNISNNQNCMTQPWFAAGNEGSGMNYWLRINSGESCKMYRFRTASNTSISISPVTSGNCTNPSYSLTENDIAATVYQYGQPIGILEFAQLNSQNTPQLEICAEGFSSAYNFTFLKSSCAQGAEPELSDRSETSNRRGFNFRVVGNPAQGEIQCRYDAREDVILNLQLVSFDGKTVRAAVLDLPAGEEQAFSLNVTDMASGLYVLSVQNGKEARIFKVMIGRKD